MLGYIIKLALIALIFGLFFMQKVGKHENLLLKPYDKIYSTFDSILTPFTKLFKSINPIKIGNGLMLDIVPFIILGILLLFLLTNF